MYPFRTRAKLEGGGRLGGWHGLHATQVSSAHTRRQVFPLPNHLVESKGCRYQTLGGTERPRYVYAKISNGKIRLYSLEYQLSLGSSTQPTRRSAALVVDVGRRQPAATPGAGRGDQEKKPRVASLTNRIRHTGSNAFLCKSGFDGSLTGSCWTRLPTHCAGGSFSGQYSDIVFCKRHLMVSPVQEDTRVPT